MKRLLLAWLLLAGVALAEPPVTVTWHSRPQGAAVLWHLENGDNRFLGRTGEPIRLPRELLAQREAHLSLELEGHRHWFETVPVAELRRADRWPLRGAVELPRAEPALVEVIFRTRPEGAEILAHNSAREPAYLGVTGQPVKLEREWLSRGSAVEVEFRLEGYQPWSETIPTGLLSQGASWPPPGKVIQLQPLSAWVAVRDSAIRHRSGLGVLALAGMGLWIWRRRKATRQALVRARYVEQALVRAFIDSVDLIEPCPVLAGYRLLRVLGRGGMATVYEVMREGEEALPKALKLLEPELCADEDFRRRLRREVVIWRELIHPGIVPLYDFGEVNGRYYLVMERVEGESLRDVLRRGPLPISEALVYLDCLMEAVAYAHERGVLHRDLKPENIMIRSDGRLQLLDFGLARRMQPETMITMAENVMGTPAYMAPEQLAGRVEARSDQFAIGCIAYEMLTGRRVVGDEDVLPVIIYKILHEEPPAPRSLRSELSEGLEKWLLRLLSKEPSARYGTVAKARAELLRLTGKTSREIRAVQAGARVSFDLGAEFT